MRLKSDDIDPLKYTTANRAVDFERWVTVLRLNLESRHSQLAAWWDARYAAARHAHARYLQLSPFARADAHPNVGHHTEIAIQAERFMRKHLLKAMPATVQDTLMQTASINCADVLFQALVDAGPGTQQDRRSTLKSVVERGPAVPIGAVLDRLNRWRFDMTRLAALGVAAPDPSDQLDVLPHFVAKLSESGREFEYRLNAYKMNNNLKGAVTQAQVDELWRYLVAESREVHGSGSNPSAKKVNGEDGQVAAFTGR